MAKSEETLTLSSRESEVLALAWQCFESEPKIDIKKLARLTGYTEGSASVTIGKIRRKLKAHGGGNRGATPASASKKTQAAPRTPKSGKRAAGTTHDETPSKKNKKAGDISVLEDEDDEDFKIKPEPEGDDGYGGYGGYGSYGSYKDLAGGL